MLKSDEVSLASVGDLGRSFVDCVREGTKFLLRCYGQKTLNSLNDARIKLWKNKIAKSNSTAPKLEALPPTDEAFQENLKRAHLQAAIWRNSLKSDPSNVNVLDFGWAHDEASKCLVPVAVPHGVKLVPDNILKIIRCGCCSESACKNFHCSCNKSGLPCSTFCECEGGINCCNPRKSKTATTESEINDVDDTDD